MIRLKTYWLYLQYFLRLKRLERINIELTNACNYKCAMCLRSGMNREQSVMPQEVFEETLSKCFDAGVKFLEFSAFGESTLDPLVYERITRAVNMGFTCSMTTNGSLLDIERILETKIHQVIFSLHATSHQEYLTYTKSKFTMEMLEEKILELKLHPRILSGELKTKVLINHYTENEVDLSDLPQSVFVADHFNVAPIYRFDKDVRTIACDIILKNLVIYVDGTVGLGCCWDVNTDLAIGHIMEKDLRSIFYSKRAAAKIRSTRSSKFCKKCYDPFYIQEYRKTHIKPRRTTGGKC